MDINIKFFSSNFCLHKGEKKFGARELLRFIEPRRNDTHMFARPASSLRGLRRGIFNFRRICILAGCKGADNRGDVFFGRLQRRTLKWRRGYVDEIS